MVKRFSLSERWLSLHHWFCNYPQQGTRLKDKHTMCLSGKELHPWMTSSPAKPGAWKHFAIFLWCAGVPVMGTCCTSWQWGPAGVHFCWRHLVLEWSRGTQSGGEFRVTSLYLFLLPAVQALWTIKGISHLPGRISHLLLLILLENSPVFGKGLCPHSSQMHSFAPRICLHIDAFLGNWNIKMVSLK